MQHPDDFMTYTERSAANVNVDASGDDAVIEAMRQIRAKAAALLSKPDLTQEARDFGERHLAKVNRWLRNVEADRQHFMQDRLLARMRQL